MAVKAALPRHFSIVVFGLTQIALDVEVLWQLARGGYPLHRFCHTYLGAAVLAGVMAVLGKPASQWIKALWNRIAATCRDADLIVNPRTTWTASVSAAFIGTFSHILLDSLFHPDIEPLQPWSATNRFRGMVNPHAVELGCIVLGVIALLWFFAREMKIRKAVHATSEPAPGAPSSAHEG